VTRRVTGVLTLMLAMGVAAASEGAGRDLPTAATQDTTKAKKKKGDQKKGDSSKVKQKKEPPNRTPAEDSARWAKRIEKSEKLPLFASRTTLPFTLIANFGRISKDRDSMSTKRYDGTLVVLDESGKEARIPVKLRTRGHYRLRHRTCRFVPLRVEFPDSGLKGTPFQGQESLKLGTHCQSDSRYEQYTMKEYLAYRIYNMVTARSFRVRLATGTYLDSATSKKVDSRTALWIENEVDVANRMGGTRKELKGALFDDVDAETVDLMALFEFVIGNTDFSIFSLHNVRVVQHSTGAIFPVPYDFDFSGLVGTTYAIPDPRLPITDVRQRLYRGPCRSLEALQPRLARILERREAIMALFREVPALSPSDARDARAFLDESFGLLLDPREVKSRIVDNCPKKPGV
jgi:hypothetical protein